MKALIISADNFEDSELLVPFYRLKEEELEVHIASMKKGKIRGKHGYEAEVDKTLEEINPDEYEILILPGGKAPAAIRKEKKALDIARDFFNKDKSVSAI
jgi:protease I